MPPPIWKKPMPCSVALFVYQSANHTMYSIPDFIVLAFNSPVKQYEAKIFPIVLSSQPGTTIGIFLSAAAIIQLFFGSIS